MVRGMKHLTASERQGLVFAFVGVLLFSFSLPMTKWALESFDPFLTATGRAVVAAPLAAIVLAARRVPFPGKAYLRPLLFTALGAAFGWPILIALALQRTTSAHTAVIAAVMPLVTALLAVLRTHERVTREFWIAASLGTGILVAFSLSRGDGTKNDLLADGLTVGAVFFSSFCYVEGASLTRVFPGWQVISWVVLLAAPITVPLSVFIWFNTHQHYSLTTHGLTGLLALGVSSMYLGFFAWYRGLAQAGTAHGSQVQQLQGLLTLIWSAILLHEHVTPATIATALGVVVCVVWAQRSRTTLLVAPEE